MNIRYFEIHSRGSPSGARLTISWANSEEKISRILDKPPVTLPSGHCHVGLQSHATNVSVTHATPRGATSAAVQDIIVHQGINLEEMYYTRSIDTAKWTKERD
jgi:hypothetical protein